MKTLLALPLLTLPLLCDVAAATPLRSQAGTYELQVMTEDAKTQPDLQRFVDFLALSKRGIIR